tara:strand:- start:47 stop:448 length:402 start_codon:yes stop_codon:yes gene_type:complete
MSTEITTLVAAHHRRAAQQANSDYPSTDAMTVGSILVSSWGYDQTNVDFYMVTRTTKTSVYIRKIRAEVTRSGGPSDSVMPCLLGRPYSDGAEPKRKKVQTYNGRPYVSLSTYASAYLWDGTAQHQTGGGYGH